MQQTLPSRPPRRRVIPVGRLTQRLRLASGLVLFAFVLMHFLNHALGLWSVSLMEQVAEVRHAIWQNPVGLALLYGAFLVHIALALWKTARRRTWRMPLAEALQLILGLTIPIMLIDHVIGTRGISTVFGFEDTYTNVLSLMWPGVALWQTTLVVVVWVHAMIGLHFWLRPRALYARLSPLLLSFAILVPTLAALGWIEGARRLVLSGEATRTLTPEAAAWAGFVTEASRTAIIALIVGAVVWGFVGAFGIFSPHRATITYPGGRIVRARPGQTLLEVSRENGIAHTSVCGGRARCSTCRTRILAGGEKLTPPRAAERAVLERIGAPANIRLACQIRPRGTLTVQPLVPAREGPIPRVETSDSYRWGVEHSVAILFVDLRGFTALSERRLPFDVVFILNEYLALMAGVVKRNGGTVDKFIGDSVMGLFGIAGAAESGAQQALKAAADMMDGLTDLNERLHHQLGETLRIGIGIHAGSAILGRIGTGTSDGLTALGDTVNIASRLETATKDLDATLVISSAVAELAGARIDGWLTERIAVRGRSREVTVHATSDLRLVRNALKP